MIDCAAAPLPDGATFLTFVDVTANVNVERALTEPEPGAGARWRNCATSFVHQCHYELRSPLTNVIGFTQLLGDETGRPALTRSPARRYSDDIMRSSAALIAIIDDILDLASVDTGALELVPGTVDIRQTITDASAGVRGPARRSPTIRLDVDAPTGLGDDKLPMASASGRSCSTSVQCDRLFAAGQTVRVTA